MAAAGEPLTVVLVDGHPVVRGGLRALLESFDGFAVVGEAAVREVQLHRPAAVIMDVMMPHVDGWPAACTTRPSASLGMPIENFQASLYIPNRYHRKRHLFAFRTIRHTFVPSSR